MCHTRTSSTSTDLSVETASHDHIPAEFAMNPDLSTRMTVVAGPPHLLPA